MKFWSFFLIGALIGTQFLYYPNGVRAETVGSVHSIGGSGGSGIPNDPLFEKQEYMGQVQVTEAWALNTGSVQVTVALLDTGVDINHPDLKNNIWQNSDEIPGDGLDNDHNGYVDDVNGWDFTEDNPDPRPKFDGPFSPIGIQHGTLLAGIIAAEGNNKLGIAGMSWRSKIMPLRILDNRAEGDVISVVRAIDYAISKKADIINLSFVSEINSAFLRDAMRRAHEAGIIIVAASGNDLGKNHGKDIAQQRIYPLCYDFDDNAVIGVAALDTLGQKAPFSNYGTCIDVAAPGMNVYTTQVVNYSELGFDAYYGSGWSGTSMATAVVTGALALAKSINKDLTPKMATDLLRSTCTSIDSINQDYLGRLGCGELNVEALVRATAEQVRGQQDISFDESVPWRTIISIADARAAPPLAFFGSDGAKRDESLYPFSPFRLSYSLAASQIQDGIFAVAAGKGSPPHVRIFDKELNVRNQFFAYPRNMKAGISVAFGDIDGDGEEEVVTVPGKGVGPHVKIFSQSGVLKRQFFAYQQSFRGGLRMALGDLNNDGKYDIVITPMKAQKGFENDIRVFDGNGVLKTQFFAYPKKSSAKSSVIATGDTDGDGNVEIIVAPADGAGQVRVFSSVGKLIAQFYPYTKRFSNGVSLAVANVNQDQRDEILAVPARNAPAHVRIFSGSGALVRQFFASGKKLRSGFGIMVVQ